MSDEAIRKVLETYLPEAAVLFLNKNGHRMVLAVTGPGGPDHHRMREGGLFRGIPPRGEEGELAMSGREIAVGAGLLIIAIGAISEADNHPTRQVVAQGPPKVLAPSPAPTHTVIVHQVTTHLVTKVTSGFPIAGWQIMVIAIAAVIVVAGAFVAVQLRRLS